VSVQRIACPECGAVVHSAAGFTAGQIVNCSKCETEFTVDAAALRSAAAGEAAEDFVPGKTSGANDAAEWSYRNSTLRYVVLGVLLVIMVGLGYMLYDKKMKERKEDGAPEGRGIPPAELPTEKDMKLPPDPTPAGGAPKKGGGAGPKGKDKTENKDKGNSQPKAKGPSVDEAKATLTGRWESRHEGRDISVEYKADGTFSYGAEQDGKADKPMTGKWKVESVEVVGTPMGTLTILKTEWAVDGQPAINEVVILRSPTVAQHLHIDKDVKDRKIRSEFKKIKK
jgi:hypothetical protein